MTGELLPLDTLIEHATAVGAWKLVQLPTSSVDLPAQPKVKVRDIIATLTDETVETPDEYLMQQRFQRARGKRSTALLKEVVSVKDGIKETHICSIEQGRINPDEQREYSITYTYTKGDYGITINAANRIFSEENPAEHIVEFSIGAVNVPMRRRSFPKITLYFENGNYICLTYTNRFETSIVPASQLHNYLMLPFPRIFFMHDLSTHQLDADRTVNLLIENINSESPKDPLQCFLFIPKSTTPQ